MPSFRKRHDNGRAFHVRSGGISMHDLSKVERDTRAKNSAMTSQHARRTLENPVVFMSFMKKLLTLNPHTGIDPQVIDRTLEPDEAMHALKRIYPTLNTSEAFNEFQVFLSELSDLGITNRKLQNMIIAEDRPLTEQELLELSYALNGRPDHALAVDKALKAKPAKSARDYLRNFNRRDIAGVDTPEKKRK